MEFQENFYLVSLNVLIIPGSWPNSEQPLHGSFIEEFVQFMADYSPETHLSVVYTGGTECGVSFSEPKEFLRILYNNWRFKKKVTKKNVSLYIEPLLNIYRLGPAYFLKKRIAKTIQIVKNEILKKGPIHLIHAHFSHSAGFIAQAISKELGIPYIITEHVGPFPFSFDKSLVSENGLSEAYLSVLREAKIIIAVSNALKDVMESYGLKNVIYIPNPIHADSFSFSKQAKDEGFNFAALSSLIQPKGVDILLKAFAEFLNMFPSKRDFFHLQIGGDGPEKEKLQRMAESLHMAQNVRFVGAIPREKVGDFYRTAHCFVHASRHESFGLVCAEAQASGLPVVVTKCGGPESIVTNAQLGYLVPKDDPHAFAKAMAEVYQNYGDFNPQHIRQHFLDNFSHQKVCQDVLEVYQNNAKTLRNTHVSVR